MTTQLCKCTKLKEIKKVTDRQRNGKLINKTVHIIKSTTTYNSNNKQNEQPNSL